jgi:hypothetical protein
MRLASFIASTVHGGEKRRIGTRWLKKTECEGCVSESLTNDPKLSDTRSDYERLQQDVEELLEQ